MSVLENLNRRRTSTIPIWLMRQAGRYMAEYQQIRRNAPSFIDLCLNTDLVCEITLQPIKAFDFDAAIIFSDILTIPHALGQSVKFVETEGPVLGELPLEKVLNENPFATLEPVLKAATILKRELSDRALLGFTGGPWTIATYMIEQGKSEDFKKILSVAHEPWFHQLMQRLENLVMEYLCAQISAGCDAVQIFDTWASVVPEHLKETFVRGPLRRILAGLYQRHPTAPVIYYARRMSKDYPSLVSYHPNLSFSVDEEPSPVWIRDVLQPLAPVQGNLSPKILLEGGKLFEDQVDLLLQSLSQGPYVFNLGHGVLPTTPVSHVKRLVEKVRCYRKDEQRFAMRA